MLEFVQGGEVSVRVGKRCTFHQSDLLAFTVDLLVIEWHVRNEEVQGCSVYVVDFSQLQPRHQGIDDQLVLVWIEEIHEILEIHSLNSFVDYIDFDCVLF